MTIDELRERWTPEREIQEQHLLMIAARQASPLPTSDEDVMQRYRQPARSYGPMPRLLTSWRDRLRRRWNDFWTL